MNQMNKIDKRLKICMVALGCAKNRVDAEIMLDLLVNRGYEIIDSLEECDVAIIHTCTFIEAANTESIDFILQAGLLKKEGKIKKIIISGCMAQRYKDEIVATLPEIDAVLGSKSFNHIIEAIESIGRYEHFTDLAYPTPEGNRILTSSNFSVYLKIADGCSNHCSYCVIPSVRGEFIPRNFNDILNEAKLLAENGAKEINIIAQDTTKYPELCKLLKQICEIDGIKWIRILYCRPEGITNELLEIINNEEKIVKYIDIPFQHASKKILKLMNRTGDEKVLLELIEKIRKKVAGIAVRTTFITGFPKEDEQDFEILCNFIKQAKFENLGVFSYSRENGTKAGKMHGQIDGETAKKRTEVVMDMQYRLLNNINSAFLGNVFDVLVESYEEPFFVGRTYFQAPEIDGNVYFTAKNNVTIGEFVKVKLNEYNDYDFFGDEI